MAAYTIEELFTFRRCRKRWEFMFLENRKHEISEGLMRAQIGNYVLREYYMNGRDMGRAIAVLPGSIPDFLTLRQMFLAYKSWVDQKNRDDFDVLEVDYPVSMRFPNGDELHTKLDMLIRSGKQIWIVSHRISRRIYISNVDVNSDLLLSIVLAEATLQEHVEGLIINYLRLKVPRNNHQFSRIYVPRPGNTETLLAEARAQMDELAKAREGRMALYRNLNPSCGWDCPFVSACVSMESSYEN